MNAGVAELADAQDLKSCGIFQYRTGSIPVSGTKRNAAGWSSLVARRAHNPEVAGSNPAPATNHGPMVKWLRHRPFTAATRVRIPVGSPKWAHSSAGRAPALQAGGHRFEPYCAHQNNKAR
jgi:hypothetical protein